jgi:hypothetical protein
MPSFASLRRDWLSNPRADILAGIVVALALIPEAIGFSLETLRIILAYSLAMAAVGVLESMLTAQIVDDLTDTPSSKPQEMKGQGIASPRLLHHPREGRMNPLSGSLRLIAAMSARSTALPAVAAARSGQRAKCSRNRLRPAEAS